jgi:hypothetical protein
MFTSLGHFHAIFHGSLFFPVHVVTGNGAALRVRLNDRYPRQTPISPHTRGCSFTAVATLQAESIVDLFADNTG